MPSVAYNADYHGETSTSGGVTMKIVLVANHTNAADTFTPSFRIEAWGKSTTAGATVSDVWVNTNGFAGSTTYKRCITKSSYTFANANTWYVVGSLTVTTSNATTYLISNMNVVNKTHSTQSLKLGYTRSSSYDNCALQIIGGFTVYNMQNFLINGDITITGIPAKTTYTVSYDANEGSGAPSTQTKWHGEAIALSSIEPSRTGYSFKNWNTSSDGSGASYLPGASYTANAAAILYAQWEMTSNITSAVIVRCDSSGNQDAIGGYVKAVVAWETDSSISGTSLALSCSSPSASATESISGTSGTTTVGPIGGSFRADSTYTFTVSLTDSLSNTVSKTVVSTASSTGYIAPVISTVSAVRSDSLGSPDDEGEYCFTTFSWSIAAIGSQTAPSSCIVKAYEYGTQTAIVTQSVTLTGTSGTNSLLVGGNVFSTDKQYVVEVTLADALNTATKSDVMSTGYFTLDVLAGGHGIAMGKPATVVDILDVGYDIHSDGEVTATDANLVSHNLTEKVDRAGDTMTGALTVDGEVTATDANDALHNLTEKANQTDVDTALAGKVSKSGDTISGTLTANGTYFCAKSTNIDRDGTAPSSTTRSDSRFFMRDKDDEFIGQMRISQDSAGMIMLELMVGNENTSNSEVTNTLSIRVAKDGTQTYAVSNQAAFRSAIGLGTDKAWTTLASGTDFYIKYAKYRNVVFVMADSKGGKTASSSDYTTLGTLPSGYRPAAEHLFASGTRGSSNTFTVRVTTAGVVGLNCSGSGGNYWAFTICFPVT